MTDCPIVVAASAHHCSSRHDPEQADPEEGRLIPRIVGNVVVQTIGYLAVDRLLRRSQCGVAYNSPTMARLFQMSSRRSRRVTAFRAPISGESGRGPNIGDLCASGR